jgi:hypothetical protein
MHSSNTCDMYMCRLKHINDSVLSSLKMEGIRLLLLLITVIEILLGGSSPYISTDKTNKNNYT